MLTFYLFFLSLQSLRLEAFSQAIYNSWSSKHYSISSSNCHPGVCSHRESKANHLMEPVR